MITITKIKTLDEAEYSRIRCPQCNSKIGWKPKGAKVHIFSLSQSIPGGKEPVGLTCTRCKSVYLISTITE